MDGKEVGDRQLDALLERLDKLTNELRGLNRRLDAGDNLAPLVYELRSLNESLQALAYAALGRQARKSVGAAPRPNSSRFSASGLPTAPDVQHARCFVAVRV